MASSRAITLTTHEALSGILGSISIACWIFLLIPQLLTNIRLHSASAISLPFLLIWFLGDICNLLGAAWAQLVPTVIAIAVYFCMADGVLIAQCFYYNFYVNRGKEADDGGKGVNGEEDEEDEEATALLAEQRSRSRNRSRSGSITIPGSQEQRKTRTRTRTISSSPTSARRRSSQTHDVLARILEDDDYSPKGRSLAAKPWLKNSLSILGIVAVGTMGWAIAWGSGAWMPTSTTTTTVPTTPGNDGGGQDHTGPWGAQILGYVSAAAYLGARIPQIVKNARERSCEGLSLLFFILSLLGNLTYGAGIICHSLDRDYLVMNLPWLVGSLGTMVEDVVIFVQFHVYARSGGEGDEDEEDEEEEEEGYGDSDGEEAVV